MSKKYVTVQSLQDGEGEKLYAKSKNWAYEKTSNMELACLFQRLVFRGQRDYPDWFEAAPLYMLQAYNLTRTVEGGALDDMTHWMKQAVEGDEHADTKTD